MKGEISNFLAFSYIRANFQNFKKYFWKKYISLLMKYDGFGHLVYLFLWKKNSFRNPIMHITNLCCHLLFAILLFFKAFTVTFNKQETSERMHSTLKSQCSKNRKLVHSNLNITNKSVRPSLFTISNNSLYKM